MSRNHTQLRIEMAGLLCALLLAVASVLAGDWGMG